MKFPTLLLALTLTCTGSLDAQRPRFTGGAGGGPDPGSPSELVPDILAKVGIDQKLDAQVPLDLAFRDDAGRTVKLADYFGTKPVVLSLVYYECPMLCTQVLNGAVAAFKVLNFTIGDEYEVVTVSFNPKETPALAAQKKSTYVAKYGRKESAPGWHFLVGDQASIDSLADSVGFRYTFDDTTQQYVHASALMVLTPGGRVSKYFYGIEYPPKDLRLGLIEASDGKIGNPVDQVLLYCFHYDPHAGKYSMIVMNVLRLGAAVTILLVGGFMVLMWGRDRLKAKSAAAEAQ
ncbi:MAG: SCO family protein [Acidobacteriota bacterium]